MSFLQEAITKTILTSLSAYISHFNEEQVKVGLWAGDLILEDVELKCAAFNTYDSAVHVKHGCIQRIRIQVPWTSFWRNPIQIDISGVDCELHVCGTYDVLHELQQKNLLVQAMLANARSSVAPSSRGWSSLFSGLSSSILDRLVRNIAVRIDDVNIYHAIAPTTVGITIHSLSFRDADPPTNDESTSNTIKVLDITDIAIYAAVGDTPHELMAPVSLHARLTQESAAKSFHCVLDVPKAIALHVPLALGPYLDKLALHRRSFSAGVKFKCHRWLALHGKSVKSTWQYARLAMLSPLEEATSAAVLKGCYATLYTKWLDSPQTSVAFMHRLNWLELQLGVTDIFEAQVDAMGRATSTRGRGRPVRVVQSPKGTDDWPSLFRWDSVEVAWEVAGVSVSVATGPFEGAIVLQQLHGQFIVDLTSDAWHHRIEVDAFEVMRKRDGECILRLDHAATRPSDSNGDAASVGACVQWTRQGDGLAESSQTSVDIVLSAVQLHVSAPSLNQMWPQDKTITGVGRRCLTPASSRPSNLAVSCSILSGAIAVVADNAWTIQTHTTDFYVKFHPRHQYQLRAASWATHLADTTATPHRPHVPVVSLQGFALCASDSILSKTVSVDLASMDLVVSSDLVHVAMRAAEAADAVAAAASPLSSKTPPVPSLSWMDGCIVAATVHCEQTIVAILDPTRGHEHTDALSAEISKTTLSRIAVEGLWQHRALQHGRATVQDVMVKIDQVELLHLAATPTTPQGLAVVVRQGGAALLHPGDAVVIDCSCGSYAMTYDPEALCQAISHAKSYADLVPLRKVQPKDDDSPPSDSDQPGQPPWGYRLEWRADSTTVLLCQNKQRFVQVQMDGMSVHVAVAPPSAAPATPRAPPFPHIDMTLHRMYMFDLTDAGIALHQNVVVPMQCDTCKDRDCHVLTYSNHTKDALLGDEIQVATLRVHAVQYTCLWRFFLEMWNYVYHPSGGIETVQTHLRRTFPSGEADAPPTAPTPMHVVYQNVAFCLPRNSDSIDMMALVMDECVFTKSYVSNTWTYDDAMTAAAHLAPSKDAPLPADGPRQKNNLHMKQVSMYCADTESVVRRLWSFRRGTYSPPSMAPPCRGDGAVEVPPPAAPIAEGAPLALDPDVVWKRVTLTPFDLLFVRDFDLKQSMQTRDLYVIEPALRLNLELTDLSILLSLWYDNLGEYPQFPTPFVPPTNYCEPYTTGPHPHFAPYTSPSQLPATHLDAQWEVGFVMHAMEFRLPLHDHEYLALQLHPLVVKVDGRLDSTFMRCVVASDRGSLDKRSCPGVPPIVLADLLPADQPFHHANINVYDAFDKSIKAPACAMQFSLVRFPYGYTMMGLSLGELTVGLASDPDVLAFVVEFFSTYFYDSEYGYPWPVPDAVAPHVGGDGDFDADICLNDLIFSERIVVHSPCVPLALNNRVFQIQSSSADLGWQVMYEWTATEASVKVHLPGVEGHFLDQVPTAPLGRQKGTPRTVLTPITIDWSYAINMVTWQQSIALDIARFDPVFPNEGDLTVFLYCIPSDVAFFTAIAAAYEASLADSAPPPPPPPSAALDGGVDDGDGDDEDAAVEDVDLDDDGAVTTWQDAWTSMTVRLPRKVGLVLLDDVLHFQKPVVQLLLCDVVVHVLQGHDPDDPDDPDARDADASFHAGSGDDDGGGGADSPADAAVFAKLTSSVQLDVFNNIVRAWEPLVEPFSVKVLVEQNGPRVGVAVSTPDSVQVNVTEYFVNACLESWGHRGSPRAAATVGLVNWTGKPVRYFQPQPQTNHYPLASLASARSERALTATSPRPPSSQHHRPLIVHVSGPKRHVSDGAVAAALACPPILSVLVGRHKVETTVLNQNDLHVLFASAHQHSTDAFRHALCGDAAAELTYDMSVQLFGFQWLHHLDLNQSGYFFFDLVPEVPHVVAPRRNDLPRHADKSNVPLTGDHSTVAALPLAHLLTSTAAVRAALRCLVHVDKTRWGHCVTLQSLFQVQNHTSFVLSVALHATNKLRQDTKSGATGAHTIQLPPGDVHRVPLQPLFEHAAMSRGKHVGFLHVFPSATSAATASLEGIHLLDLIRPNNPRQSKFIHTCQLKTHLCVEVTSSCRHATKKGRWSRLFRPSLSQPSILPNPTSPAADDKDASQLTTLILHPPLTLQNLLCVNIVCCVFRMVPGTPPQSSHGGRDVVWEGTIKAGGQAAIYASNLADKLYCSVLLPALQCETVKPALLHVPAASKVKVDTVIAFADKTNSTQPLKLKVENTVGSGGQRAVVLYASYWLVNLTPFGLQYKQDTRHFEIAGSAAVLTRRQSIDDDKRTMWNVLACDLELQPYLYPPGTDSVDADDAAPGQSGPAVSCMPSMRRTDGRCSFSADSHDLCFCPAPSCAARRLARFATMFSFGGGGNTVGFEDTVTAAFTNSLCIKCPKYSWSKGVSLEVLGVDQAVELKNTTHVLELGVKIIPGPEAFYRTKCVIFTPRFLVLNQLSTSLALYDGLHRLNTVLPPHDMQPFIGHLKLPVRRRHRGRVQYLSTQRIHESSGKFSLEVVGPTDLSLVANTSKSPKADASTKPGNRFPTTTTKPTTPTPLMVDHTNAPLDIVRVHTRLCGPTYVTLLSPLKRVEEVAYRIDNQTASHVLYYRQVGVDSPTNGWNELGPGKSTVYVWAEPLALHQLSICLQHQDTAARPSQRQMWTTRAAKLNALLLSPRKPAADNELKGTGGSGGGWCGLPSTTKKSPPMSSQFGHQAKHFGYTSTLLSERKGLGLDEVEAINLDVIGLQMSLVRPATTTSTAALGGGGNDTRGPQSATQSGEPNKLANHGMMSPSDLLSKPFLQKPKRPTSCARIENDGVTRVLRVRDTTGLDDEKTTFVKEETRVQRLLFQLLALQSSAAFATVHSSAGASHGHNSPLVDFKPRPAQHVSGHRRTATDFVSSRSLSGVFLSASSPSIASGGVDKISRSLRTSSCVIETSNRAHQGHLGGRDTSGSGGGGGGGLTLFQSMQGAPKATVNKTDEANRALYDRMLPFMTSPVLEDVHQVSVQIVSASGLKAAAPADGGWSNPYCIVTMVSADCKSGATAAAGGGPTGRFAAMASSKFTSAMAKRMEQKTYYVERTLDPVWRDQAFLFEKTNGPDAKTTVRIDIRSHSALGKHVFLGRAVVEIGGDADLVKHVTVRLTGAKSHHVVTGSVQVVVQTSRTQRQLLEYWYHRLRQRIQVLSEQLVYLRSRVRQIDKERAMEHKRKLNVAVEHHAKQAKGRAKAKALLLQNKDKLVAHKNKLKDKWTQQLQQLQHPIHMNEKFAHFRDAAEKRWLHEVKKLHKTNVRTSILHVKRLFAKESQLPAAAATPASPATKDHGGLSLKASMHKLRSVHHVKPQTATSHGDYVADIKRCYHRLIRSGGNVVVGVSEGRHFAGLGLDKVHCIVVCQDTTIVTPKAKADDVVMWPPTTAAAAPVPKIPLRRHRGDLVVHVVGTTKHSASTRVLGHVRLPVDVALDYCGSHGGTFSTWFPLTPVADAAPVELDLHKLLNPVEMKLGYATPPSSAPCIHLSVAYEPEQSSFVVGHLLSYVSVFVGELALSLSAPVAAVDPANKDNAVETHEMLRISFAGIDAKCLKSSKQCQWTLDLDSFQVDNQRSGALNQTELPVMVSRASPSGTSAVSCSGVTPSPSLKPLLQAVVITHPRKDQQLDGSAARSGSGSPTSHRRGGGGGGQPADTASRHMTHIELAALSIEETDWTFDEVILRTLYDVCERLYDKHQPLFGASAAATSTASATAAPPTLALSSVYIARLEVRPFKCNITFRKSTTYAATASTTLAMQNLKSKFMHSFVAAIFNIANTIENAPLEFNALRLDHEITDVHHLQDYVFQHYATNVLRQLYKLIGSMNFMGNPVGLAANVAGGVRDFVVQPYTGLTSGGATGFVRGLTKGTASLLGHTAFGLFDTTSRMTGAMGNTVVAFSHDRVFKAKRNVYALARPTSRRDQLRLDVKKLKHDVCSGIIGGVTGLVMDPIRGGRRGGLGGLAGGVAHGLSGVVVKPVVGAIDLVTHVVEGARDVAGLAFETKKTAFDKHRKRMSHAFGADGRLLPHDAADIWSSAVVEYLHDPPPSRRHLNNAGALKVTDIEPTMQIVWAAAFKTDVGRVSLVVVRKSEVLCAEIATANWQRPRLLWRVPADRVVYVERVSATHVSIHSRPSVERQAKPFHVAKIKSPKRKMSGHKSPRHPLCNADGGELDGAYDQDNLDAVAVATSAWEDARHFERDAAKMSQLVAVLRQQYAFVDSVGDDAGDDVRTKWVVEPPAPPPNTALQQFAFQRLHETQETLKTQYCVNEDDEARLERSPWTEVDGQDAAKLWTGCVEPPATTTSIALPPADETKKAKTRAPSVVSSR